MMSMGDADEVFPFNGGTTAMGAIASGRSSRSWAEMSDELVGVYACDPAAEVTDFALWSRPTEPTTAWHREEFANCISPLRLTTVEGIPHTWLWGGDWSHTREVLDFFGIGATATG
ncbi:MAG: hypothetical protein ACR2OH_00265, partial [Microthrixaceae bacterium]